MLKLTEVVALISPAKEEFITLLKLYETINREYPETDRRLEAAYTLFLRRAGELWPEVTSEFPTSLTELESFCLAHDCMDLYEALSDWATSTRTSREGSILGLLVIGERHALEHEKPQGVNVDFTQAFRSLQLTVLEGPSELDALVTLPLTIDAFDPTRMTVKEYKRFCLEHVEVHIDAALKGYQENGYRHPKNFKEQNEEDQFRRLARWRMEDLSYSKVAGNSDKDYSQIGREIRELHRLMGTVFRGKKDSQ